MRSFLTRSTLLAGALAATLATAEDATTSVASSTPSPTAGTSVAPSGAVYGTQTVMTTPQFFYLIGFTLMCYYISIYLCAKAVGENTSAMTAPARYAGSAANATGGVIGRAFRFLRSKGGRVAYIPLAPSDGDLGGPARRRAMDIGHGNDHDDVFSGANQPSPSVSH